MHFKKLALVTLLPTVFAGRITWYNPESVEQNDGYSGMGSCGGHLFSGLAVAALAGVGYGNDKCGSTIAVKNLATGACIEVPVVDECAGCSGEDVDLTPGAFSQLASLDQGQFDGTYWFGSCNGAQYSLSTEKALEKVEKAEATLEVVETYSSTVITPASSHLSPLVITGIVVACVVVVAAAIGVFVFYKRRRSMEKQVVEDAHTVVISVAV